MAGDHEKTASFDGQLSPPGPRAPWWGVQRATPPCPPEASVRREPSETLCVQTRTTCRMPLTNPRGLQNKRCGMRESSTLVSQSGRPLCATVPHGSCLRRQGVRPLDPGCHGTLGLSDGSRPGKDVVRTRLPATYRSWPCMSSASWLQFTSFIAAYSMSW